MSIRRLRANRITRRGGIAICDNVFNFILSVNFFFLFIENKILFRKFWLLFAYIADEVLYSPNIDDLALSKTNLLEILR